MKKTIKPIKAWAVAGSTLDSYYTYDDRDGEDFALAMFRTRKEAKAYHSHTQAGMAKVIPVLITPITPKKK